MKQFAAYAVTDTTSRGRAFTEARPESRSEFQRDRDRIVHSTAFRRLEYKTQVFVNHEGDLFRTRLTHSIEVAQVARAIASALKVNDDLTEAIALAHDLGHTPFGHAGQDALNECMQSFTKGERGFEHNLQSLRSIDLLEEHYGAFDGLNLMYETREGILKHCSPQNARLLGELGLRFLENRRPSIEAQICNLADEIAYNNHDIDDGIRSGLISFEQMESVGLFARHAEEAKQEFPKLVERRLVYETIRRIIGAQVRDLLETTQAAIAELAPHNLNDVHLAPVLCGFSEKMQEENLALKKFLFENLYQHYQVLRMTTKARRIIHDLFSAFMADKKLLPPQYQERAHIDHSLAVSDYIAGMTDRYAMKEHRRLYAVGEI